MDPRSLSRLRQPIASRFNTTFPSAHLSRASCPYLYHRRQYATDPPSSPSAKENPILANYLSQKARRPQTQTRPQAPKQGDLNSSSIFELANPDDIQPPPHKPVPFQVPEGRNGVAMAAKLDPQPEQRRRWERKMVIREVMKRGRISKAMQIKRSERQIAVRSDFWKTSVKKLAPLARQISGKTLDDAMVQMRHSKKKAAYSIWHHLTQAGDKAIVERGMGVGGAPGAKIKLKDGSAHKVKSRKDLYIAEAWVNRGPFGQDRLGRAKGRIDMLRLPKTSITVVLKEEITRIRQHHERLAKTAAKKPWVHLPDRPVTAQRPYYCW